jgi:hypothetical protein
MSQLSQFILTSDRCHERESAPSLNRQIETETQTSPTGLINVTFDTLLNTVAALNN